MKSKAVKKILAVGLAAAMTAGMLAGCGGGDKDAKGNVQKEAQFTWFINKMDDGGEYYETYEEAPAVQYINQLTWDVENGGVAEDGEGKPLQFSYLVPITGSERDNFSTMISTGEYPEIVDLAYSTDSPNALYENGVLMNITEYVEKYMPNYLAFLDENPELKPLVQMQDEDGNIIYNAIYAFADGVEDPWEGSCYRRDWIVKYAEPTEYVWDWDSDYVKENGHPEVTPLEKAQSENNLNGWKKNEVTEFKAEYGDDPNMTYTDNVIFPSGKSDPITISDWEWMFVAFDKAIAERGWADDSSAYATTIQYAGYSQMGDITSSFGGGTGTYYVKDGEVSYDGDSENFKVYLECMQNWYEKGWLDSQFFTRAADMFFQINTAGVNQGKVGLWCGLSSSLGTAIRTSCQDASDQADAYVMGAALPINDMYGGKDQLYKEPDSLYQGSRKGTPVGITTKAEGKDLAALFTFLDWTYTREGAEIIRLGLNEEQYKSVKLDPDMYAEYDVTTAYTKTEEDGQTKYVMTYGPSDTISGALIAQRMDVGIKLTGNDVDYIKDNGNPAVHTAAMKEWTKFLNTGNVLDYSKLLSVEESEQYSKISTALTDYQSANVPLVIKGEMSWDDYVAGIADMKPDDACKYLQKYVDMANAAE